jgi:hypothetical protein
MSRKRNPNFSESEIQILVDEVEKSRQVLFSKFSNTSTNSSKKRAWLAICEKINSVHNFGYKRTPEEIKKKWSSYMSDAKRKASYRRREAEKTGGGPPPPELSAMEEKVVGIMGSTSIAGIEGGIDTCDDNTTASSSVENGI